MTHYSGNILQLFLSGIIYFYLALSHVVLPCSQAAQLAYIMDERLKEAAEDVDQEKALKDVVVATASEKSKTAATAKRRAKDSEKAWELAKKRLTKLDVKLGNTELNLAKVESLNLAQADKIAALKASLEAYEDKWYNTGFAEVENSAKPIVHEAQNSVSRRVGWLLFMP